MKPEIEKNETQVDSEKRKYERISKNTSVMAGRLTYPVNEDDLQDGRIENLSLGGLLMTTPKNYETGTIIQVKIKLPGWHKNHPGFMKVMEDSIGSPFTAVCEVLRSEEQDGEFQTAAKYINIDPDDFIAYENYMQKELIR